MEDITFVEKIKLKFILLCHILLVCFAVLSPFINSNYILFTHAMIMPFIVVHWLVNNNICALTMAEKKIREKLYGKETSEQDCFTCKIIDPVYDFKNNYEELSHFIYGIVLTLWSISLFRLYCRYKNGEIKCFSDLFIL
jgi:hypothetical protein